MSLATVASEALRAGPVRVEAEGVVVEAEVTDVDRLGVSLDRLRVVAPGRTLAGAVASLPEAAGRALGEPLVVSEVSEALGGAVVRTAPGQLTDGEFFELHTSGGDSSIERWRVGPGGRERVPFALTRGAFGRAVEALARPDEPG